MIIIGYATYFPTIAMLFIGTGLFMVRFDRNNYDNQGLLFEKKVTKFMTWINITLGISILLVGWVYTKWMW